MAMLEAAVLPKEKSEPTLQARLERAGAEGTTGPMPGVLMLRSPLLSHHAVRAGARRAGLPVTLELAENRSEFLEILRSAFIDVILASTAGMPDLPFAELLDRARSLQPPIPVIVVAERMDERDSVQLLRAGAADYVLTGEMDRLPFAIERACRSREAAAGQARLRNELDRAASMLRENQKLITVGRLAASITHEINNPLESVTNLLYLLHEDPQLSESSQGYLTLARRELDRVAQISRQTLNFARETAGPQRARVDELLEEVLSLYGRRIAEKNLRVERKYDCPEEATVYPGEMRQVLSNLVTNAVEASSMNGRLCLRVRRSRSWSDPGVRGIRIAVADTGSGIEPAVQRRLGEPFFTTKGQRGTGLGLWVTRSIVQRYGGEIQLRSSTAPEHHGTVFTLFLPTNLGPRAVERTRDSGESPETARSRVVPLESSPSSRPRVGEAKPRRRVNGD